MKINKLDRLSNNFIKKIYTSERIIDNKYWKLATTSFSQKHIITPKFFELGMLYKTAKEAIPEEGRRIRTYLKDISKIKKINVTTSEAIKETTIIDVNPQKHNKYLLFAHGGGTTITSNHYQEMYKVLAPSIGVLAPEYRGYGSSLNQIGAIDLRKTMFEDIEGGYNYLKEKGIKDEDIILTGYCSGCTPAIELAKKHQTFKKLILIAPYVSFKYIPAADCFQTYLNTHNYKSPDIENISQVDIPTIIIHTKGDKVVPFEATIKLSEKAKNLEKFYVLSDKIGHDFNKNKIDLLKKIIDEDKTEC